MLVQPYQGSHSHIKIYGGGEPGNIDESWESCESDEPCLHGDTLEHGEHGEADVVEGRDAVVGALPLLSAEGHGEVAGVGAAGGRGQLPVITRNLPGALRHNLICSTEFFFLSFLMRF